MKPRAQTKSDLEELDEALTVVVGSILQTPNRVAGNIIGVAASKLVAAGVTIGTFGAIGAFGVASTGTAIASLSGAAATTASLYWIGSTVGLGVVAGGVMLTGGALSVGVPSAIYVRKKLFGRPRSEHLLSSCEQSLLYAALRLATAARTVRAGNATTAPTEKRLVAIYGVDPLAAGLRTTFFDKEQEDTEWASQNSSLTVWHRQRLHLALRKLERLSAKWREL